MNFTWEALFLIFTTLVLSYTSELFVLSGCFILWILFALRKHLKKDTKPYRKLIAYLAIIPFALWWTLSPSGKPISPWLFIIPSYYFLFLAIYQYKSVFKGGFPVFVHFNGLLVLLLSLRHPDKILIVLIACALIFLLLSVRPQGGFLKYILFLLLSFVLSLSLFFGFQELYQWRRQHLSNAFKARADERLLMGFSSVASLGSFKSDYISEKNAEIVLRLWTNHPPKYFRGIAYDEYSHGIWSLPKKQNFLYPEFYIGDHAVFNTTDTNSKPVWVKSSLKNTDFGFAPLNAGIAYKDADSLNVYEGNSFEAPENYTSNWYYIPKKELQAKLYSCDLLETLFCKVPKRLEKDLNALNKKIGLDSLNANEKALKIQKYLLENFSYSLQVESSVTEDPILVFMKKQSGFCEYFATLATLLLREQKMPARYVVGFSNPEQMQSDYAVFRRKNAHAWVEYFDGYTWKILDATPPFFISTNEESFLESKKELLFAKISYLTHLLMDGSWRKTLDSWSVFLETNSKNPYVYLSLVALFLILFRKRLFKIFKKENISENKNFEILELQKLLENTEKQLSNFHLSRNKNETVFQFYNRIKTKETETKQKETFQKLLENLLKYDKERWKI